jgi:hypothetical protein
LGRAVLFVFRRGCWAKVRFDRDTGLHRLAGDSTVLFEEVHVRKLSSEDARGMLHWLDSESSLDIRRQALVFLADCDLEHLDSAERALIQLWTGVSTLPDELPWSHVRRKLRRKLGRKQLRHGLALGPQRVLLERRGQGAQTQGGGAVSLVNV